MRIAHLMLVAALCAVGIILGVSHVRETANAVINEPVATQWPEPSTNHKDNMTTNIQNNMTTNYVVSPSATDRAAFKRAMTALALAESHNKDCGLHPDGVSWGKFGITLTAVAQLRTKRKISELEHWLAEQHPSRLAAPVRNERYARLYFALMLDKVPAEKRTGEYLPHIGLYHGGNAARMDRYRVRALKRLREYEEKNPVAKSKILDEQWSGDPCRVPNPCYEPPTDDADIEVIP